MPLLAGEKILASRAPGWVAEDSRSTSSSAITTTETVLQSVTFTAVAAARYKITALQSVQSSVAGDLIQVRIRYSTGPTLSTSGTELLTQLPNADIAGKGQILASIVTVTDLPDGEVTVGVTAVRDTGTGNVLSYGDARQTNTILVERV